MIVKNWMVLVPLALVIGGAGLALLQHPVLGGEIVAFALVMLGKMLHS